MPEVARSRPVASVDVVECERSSRPSRRRPGGRPCTTRVLTPPRSAGLVAVGTAGQVDDGQHDLAPRVVRRRPGVEHDEQPIGRIVQRHAVRAGDDESEVVGDVVGEPRESRLLPGRGVDGDDRCAAARAGRRARRARSRTEIRPARPPSTSCSPAPAPSARIDPSGSIANNSSGRPGHPEHRPVVGRERGGPQPATPGQSLRRARVSCEAPGS